MRFRNSIYQPVMGGEFAGQGVLQYTPAEVGVVDVSAGSITDATSDYPVLPEAEFNQSLIAPPTFRRRMAPTGRVPYTYQTPAQNKVMPDGLVGSSATSNMDATGAPDTSVLRLDDHGPWNAVYADGRIPISPEPKHATWFGKWFGSFFTPKKDNHRVQQLGRANPDSDDPMLTTFGTDHNAFQIPDQRATWNTEALPGVGVDPKGRAYVPKAGAPMEAPWQQPSEDKIVNERLPLTGDSPPFMGQANRTVAGAANPVTDARPAFHPIWYGERPFDQNEAQHLTGLKGVMRDPIAGRPVMTAVETQSEIAHVHTGQRGNLINTPAPGMTPSGPMPNTLRQSPSPWDSDLYVASESQSLRRNFRGRK